MVEKRRGKRASEPAHEEEHHEGIEIETLHGSFFHVTTEPSALGILTLTPEAFIAEIFAAKALKVMFLIPSDGDFLIFASPSSIEDPGFNQRDPDFNQRSRFQPERPKLTCLVKLHVS